MQRGVQEEAARLVPDLDLEALPGRIWGGRGGRGRVWHGMPWRGGGTPGQSCGSSLGGILPAFAL